MMANTQDLGEIIKIRGGIKTNSYLLSLLETWQKHNILQDCHFVSQSYDHELDIVS